MPSNNRTTQPHIPTSADSFSCTPTYWLSFSLFSLAWIQTFTALCVQSPSDWASCIVIPFFDLCITIFAVQKRIKTYQISYRISNVALEFTLRHVTSERVGVSNWNKIIKVAEESEAVDYTIAKWKRVEGKRRTGEQRGCRPGRWRPREMEGMRWRRREMKALLLIPPTLLTWAVK